jgi:hypothetical protein
MKIKSHCFSICTMLVFSVLFWSSSSQKEVLVTDGSRADGTLTMSYEYDDSDKPKINWDGAKKKAIKKCESWGYSDAEFFEGEVKKCISKDKDGCNRWEITYKCQCTVDDKKSKD